MRAWGCWRSTPRAAHISPCGYDKNEIDQACKGCADNPATMRAIENEKKAQEIQRKVQKSWARRWKNTPPPV